MNTDLAFRLLAAWARHAERYWHALPNVSDFGFRASDSPAGGPGLGCYGAGYNSWGVQTNQKYLAALATLAMRGPADGAFGREQARDRALAALRFSIASHVSGAGRCTDNTQWGHTWISALGIERMMHGVYLLEPELSDGDRAALRRLLTSEAEWLYAEHRRGDAQGIVADPWAHTGRNVPESNLWNGALLWRVAVMYPDHPRAADWQERAHQFLINSVSVAADAEDGTVVAGKPVRERHVGANFFPHYGLDHHGYFNVGYMTICVSNAAMLHFDLKLRGLPRPESLDWHEGDLWQVLRRMVFADGRLARLGGDSRVRYAYCQEYLLPSLLYAADRLGDRHALDLAEAQMALIETEAAHNADGGFYGKRLADSAAGNLYYFTRLESDRACALSQLCVYAPLVRNGERRTPNAERSTSKAGELDSTTGDACASGFETSVRGAWCEPEHGSALHRSPRRLASFAWRAFGLGQGMCQPPGDGHLTEWEENLTGRIEVVSAQYPRSRGFLARRRLLDERIDTFAGGFAASGAFTEGADVEFTEGWRGKDMATHRLVFVALPDERTVVGLEYCHVNAARCCIGAVKGLHLCLANDLFNGFRRRLTLAGGRRVLRSPPRADSALPLGGRWACIDGRVGVVGLYGASDLVVHRSARRRAGAYRSLHVEEVCWPYVAGPGWVDPGTVLLDAGWAVLSGTGARETRTVAEDPQVRQLPLPGLARAVTVRGADGRLYLVVANFAGEPCVLPVAALLPAGAAGVDLASGERLAAADALALAPGQCRVFVVQA